MKHLLVLLVYLSWISLSSSETICSNGFQLMKNGKCWGLVRQLKGYNEAEQMCRFSNGAVVVQPQNSNQNNDLVAFLTNANISEIWMGLRCSSTNLTSCQWEDITHFGDYGDYTNFTSGSPNGKDTCFSFQPSNLNQGNWVSTPCDEKLRFVCELPTTTKDCNKRCNANYNNYCYNIYKTAKKLIDAEQFCEQQNGHLVTIHNYLEWRFVAQMYRDQGSYWIGGIMNPKNTIITWLDGIGEDFAVANMKKHDDGICVQFDVNGNSLGAGWIGKNCDGLKSFICKLPAFC